MLPEYLLIFALGVITHVVYCALKHRLFVKRNTRFHDDILIPKIVRILRNYPESKRQNGHQASPHELLTSQIGSAIAEAVRFIEKQHREGHHDTGHHCREELKRLVLSSEFDGNDMAAYRTLLKQAFNLQDDIRRAPEV